MMGRIIAISNQKGGVGKTTTAVNLSSCLAAAEKKTLLVDLDPQCNAGSGFGISVKSSDESIYPVILGKKKIDDIIKTTELKYLKIAPSHIDLIGAEVELINEFAREKKISQSIEDVISSFDYIIIDCPPSLGLLTINSLTASDSVLIPIQCEYYALEGLGQLLNTIRLVQKHLNMNLKIEGVLLTMYDSRLNLCKQVADETKKYFMDKVYKTVIPRNVKLSEAPSFGKPIILYDILSKGAKSYLQLAQEVIKNG